MCEVTPESWLGSVAKSWNNQTPDEVEEYFVFTREAEDIFCTSGEESGVNCYSYDDKTKCITHNTHKNVKGCANENGEVEWSHGPYTSALVDPCGKKGECKVEWDDLVDRSGISWDTRDESKKTESYWYLEKEDGTYCFMFTSVGRVCGKTDGRMLLFHDTWHTGRLEPNGEITWSNGYTSKVDGPICGEKAKKEVKKYFRFFKKLFWKMHEVMTKEMKKQLTSIDEGRFAYDMAKASRKVIFKVCKHGCDLEW